MSFKVNEKVILKLDYIDTDFWGRPVYKDQFARLWKDIDLGNCEIPSLCWCGNEIDGEPDYYINNEFVIVTPYIKIEKEFEYMMLSRLQTDCEAYLSNVYKLDKKQREKIIKDMKELWNSFTDNEKPEWITWKDILEYEKKMSV